MSLSRWPRDVVLQHPETRDSGGTGVERVARADPGRRVHTAPVVPKDRRALTQAAFDSRLAIAHHEVLVSDEPVAGTIGWKPADRGVATVGRQAMRSVT